MSIKYDKSVQGTHGGQGVKLFKLFIAKAIKVLKH